MLYEDVISEDSIARHLTTLVCDTAMSPVRRLEFLAVVARVRRLELFVDEVVNNAREDAAMVVAAENVVHVDFARGAR